MGSTGGWAHRADSREPDVAHQLEKITAESVLLGSLSPVVLSKLVSSWTHHMMFARASLCVFQEVCVSSAAGGPAIKWSVCR